MRVVSYLIVVFFLIMSHVDTAASFAACQTPQQFATVQAAVDSVNCDTIIVAGGTYVENVVIGRSVVIQNAPNEQVVVDGGGIDSVFTLTGSNVTLDGLTIRNGSAENGGGINSSASNLTLLNVTIENNSAEMSGGGIFQQTGQLSLSNFNLNNNSASNGGGIRADNAAVTLVTGRVEGNEAQYSGGGVSVREADMPLNVNGVAFQNNTAGGNASFGTGGGIHVYYTPLQVQYSSFVGNSSGQEGGAISGLSTDITVENSTFNGNTAAASGGAISVETSVIGDNLLSVQSSQFVNNQAGGSGGAIYGQQLVHVQTNPRRKMQLQGTQFYNNDAKDGGAIMTFGGVDLTLADSVLENNEADERGGAVYVRSYIRLQWPVMIATTILNYSNTSMSNNRAGTYGGAIAGIFASINVTSGLLSNNTAQLDGGAIHVSGPFNIGHPMRIENALIADNIAGGDGGAIWNDELIYIRSAHITRNEATNGGGIYVASGSGMGKLDIAALSLDNNRATEKGGGVYSAGEISADLHQMSLTDNHADSGGGLFTVSPVNSLSEILIANNVVATDGGGVHGEFTLHSAAVVSNTAGSAGGGLFSTGAITVESSTISTNHATVGSGLFANRGRLTFVTVANNQLGAALYKTDGDQLWLSHAIIDNPTVANCAGDTDSVLGEQTIDSDGTCTLPANRSNLNQIDPRLEPLADNGGSTFTHALADQSPALGMGATCIGSDQRGVGRPQTGCDVGAYQSGNLTPTATALRAMSVGSFASRTLFLLSAIGLSAGSMWAITQRYKRLH